jgi:hypothetical protein
LRSTGFDGDKRTESVEPRSHLPGASGRSDRSTLRYWPADRRQLACFPCPFSAARSRIKLSRFSTLGPGVGQAITFDDRDRLARVLIRPIPAPKSCVLGVGPRNQCAIRHMPMVSLRLQASFLARESGHSLSILLGTCVEPMRDLGRTTHPWGFGCPYPQRASVLKL